VLADAADAADAVGSFCIIAKSVACRNTV